MIVNALASLALAGPPAGALALSPEPSRPPAVLAERSAPTDVRVVARGLAELRHDPYLATRFGTGGLGAGLGLVVPVVGPFAVDAEIAYGRAQATGDGGGSGVLQVLPVTVLAEMRWTPQEGHQLELFGGVGPALTMWSESGQDEDWMRENAEDPEAPPPTVLRGARPGVEVRIGTRVDLGLVQPSLEPIPQGAVRGIELEILVARRFAPSASGFDLNSWRGGAGIALRF